MAPVGTLTGPSIPAGAGVLSFAHQAVIHVVERSQSSVMCSTIHDND
jgi:hypothetical protein